jgi:hypothetical protein
MNMEEKRNAHRILIVRAEGKRRLGKSKYILKKFGSLIRTNVDVSR